MPLPRWFILLIGLVLLVCFAWSAGFIATFHLILGIAVFMALVVLTVSLVALVFRTLLKVLSKLAVNRT